MKSFRRIAKVLSESPLFSKARLKWEENQRDWHLALTKLDKLGIGVFLILRDYAAETFGATSDNEQQAYKAEIDYKKDLPGLTEEEARLSDLRKPFWDADSLDYYLQHLITLVRALEKLDILPPSRLLELGCGSGWTAEFLATRGYHVVGTSIADIDIADARLRKKSLVAKGLPDTLEFFVSPMENIDEAVDKKASLRLCLHF